MNEVTMPWMWFGKIPGLGDFVHRNMPDSLREQLDRWFQSRLQEFSTSHPQRWSDYYLSAPVWRFVWGSGITDLSDPVVLTGICMPSVDRVGRYFPLIVIGQCKTEVDTSELDFFENDLQLTSLSTLALRALDEDWDADRLEAALQANIRRKPSKADIDALIQCVSQSEKLSSNSFFSDLSLVSSLAAKTRTKLRIGATNTLWYRVTESEYSPSTPSVLVCEGLPDQPAFHALMGCESTTS